MCQTLDENPLFTQQAHKASRPRHARRPATTAPRQPLPATPLRRGRPASTLAAHNTAAAFSCHLLLPEVLDSSTCRPAAPSQRCCLLLTSPSGGAPPPPSSQPHQPRRLDRRQALGSLYLFQAVGRMQLLIRFFSLFTVIHVPAAGDSRRAGGGVQVTVSSMAMSVAALQH